MKIYRDAYSIGQKFYSIFLIIPHRRKKLLEIRKQKINTNRLIKPKHEHTNFDMNCFLHLILKHNRMYAP